jgi:hypothetical protein
MDAGKFEERRMMARPADLDLRVGAVASHILRRLTDAAVEDMRARYDFGRVLHGLRQRRRGSPGAGVVRLLADRLGVDATALRRYAQVSEVIGVGEFDWMMHLSTPRGAPLTWSHIELLSRVRNTEQRRQLAAATVREDLSVRALSERLRASR